MKKKQGPPEPLSEEHFAKLKRKAGLPVDDPPVKEPVSKRRKTAKKPEPQSNGKATKPLNGKKSASKLNGSGKKKAKEPSPEADSDDDLDDEFGSSDLDLDDVSLDSDDNDIDRDILGDEFIGSDEDSVVDSDQEMGGRKEKFVFSDDEDASDSDREERLTAANIEGLSRKLDKQLQDDQDAADAELRESALQTNIDGDKPKVLDDEDDDDDLAMKGQSLLAPDLQMLRQRITDTIRVLDDFAGLAETGRSRVDYTTQLLKDVCAVSCLLPPSFNQTLD